MFCCVLSNITKNPNFMPVAALIGLGAFGSLMYVLHVMKHSEVAVEKSPEPSNRNNPRYPHKLGSEAVDYKELKKEGP